MTTMGDNVTTQATPTDLEALREAAQRVYTIGGRNVLEADRLARAVLAYFTPDHHIVVRQRASVEAYACVAERVEDCLYRDAGVRVAESRAIVLEWPPTTKTWRTFTPYAMSGEVDVPEGDPSALYVELELRLPVRLPAQ